MIKKISILFFLGSLSTLFSQNLDIVHSFPFGSPFDYYESWDNVEGVGPGIHFLDFPNAEIVCIGNKTPASWMIYRTMPNDWNLIENVSAEMGPYYCVGNNKNIVLYEFYSNKGIYVYETDNPINYTHYIPYDNVLRENRVAGGLPLFITENILIFENSRKKLFTWELQPDGTYTFRDAEETQQWFEEGMGEYLGYHKGPSNYDNYFGDFRITGIDTVHTGYIWRDYIFEDSQFPDLTSLRGWSPLGYDSHGINYFYIYGPEPFSLDLDRLNYPYQIVIAIVDTWTKKVYFRMLPEGAWTPPRLSENNQTIGTYPKAIHPNGDIYFFDADLELQEYQLKRLQNDWYPEMGVDQRRIGRMEHNHIPLQNEPNDAAGNNGYNFANEFIWVLEEGPEIDGGDRWVLVRKIDGREGWIRESELYFE